MKPARPPVTESFVAKHDSGSYQLLCAKCQVQNHSGGRRNGLVNKKYRLLTVQTLMVIFIIISESKYLKLITCINSGKLYSIECSGRGRGRGSVDYFEGFLFFEGQRQAKTKSCGQYKLFKIMAPSSDPFKQTKWVKKNIMISYSFGNSPPMFITIMVNFSLAPCHLFDSPFDSKTLLGYFLF